MVSERVRNAYLYAASLMITLLLAIVVPAVAAAQTRVVYPRIETGAHTARIARVAVDRAERSGNEGKFYAVTLSPGGTRIALSGVTGTEESRDFPIHLFGAGDVRILDVADLTRELASDDDCRANSYGVDFDPAGRLVASCNDGFLRLYDVQGQRIAKRKVDGGAQPHGVHFSPDGERIEFAFDVWDGHEWSRSLARFDLTAHSLETAASAAAGLRAPRIETGLARIDEEIQALVKRARPEDVVVIYLADHRKAPDGQYHFIPADLGNP